MLYILSKQFVNKYSYISRAFTVRDRFLNRHLESAITKETQVQLGRTTVGQYCHFGTYHSCSAVSLVPRVLTKISTEVGYDGVQCAYK